MINDEWGHAMVNDKIRGGIVCVAPSGLDCMVAGYLGFRSLRSFHPRLFCVTASRFFREGSMTATFQAAELGRSLYTGSLTAFALACAVRLVAFSHLFVVGLQPTIGGLAGTQGFAHLRFASPCARLWSPYRARRAGHVMTNDK